MKLPSLPCGLENILVWPPPGTPEWSTGTEKVNSQDPSSRAETGSSMMIQRQLITMSVFSGDKNMISAEPPRQALFCEPGDGVRLAPKTTKPESEGRVALSNG